MKNNIKDIFNKIDVPDERRDIIFNDVLRKSELAGHGEKENTMKNKLKFVIAGVAAAACILLAVFALPALTKEETPQIVQNPPELSASPVPSDIQTEPVKLPDAYTQRLASIAYQVDDWIYFAHSRNIYDPQNGIYKISKNSTIPIKLCDATANDLIVEEDFIYFIEILSEDPNGQRDCRVMRVKTDGTGKTEIFKNPNTSFITDLQLSDGYLFVTDHAAIYKIAMDGTGYEEFIDPVTDGLEKSLPPNLIGDFFKEDEIASGKFIYKMGLLQYLTVHDGWMYYYTSSFSEDRLSGLVKKNTDGAEKELLYEGTVYEKTVRGDWIYFLAAGSDGDDYYTCLAKIKTDGTGFQELKKQIDNSGFTGLGLSDKIFADDEWVYFSFERNSGWQEWQTKEICRIRTDGTDYQVLANECAMTSVTDDFIYYNNYWDNNSASFVSNLMQMKKDGSGKQRIDFFATETASEETYEIQENSLSVIVKDAYEKDGKRYLVLDQVTEYEVDGTYGFNNENENVREFEISDDAKFVMLKDGEDKNSLTDVSWEFFMENAKKQLSCKSKKVPGYYRIAIDQSGVIMNIQFYYWYNASVKLPYEILETASATDNLPQPEQTPDI